MRRLLLLLIISVLFDACQQPAETEIETVEPTEEESLASKIKVTTEEKVVKSDFTLMDSVTAAKLGRLYDYIPFYTKVGERTYVIVSSAKKEIPYFAMFDGTYQYGLVNDSLENVLPIAYDKIYNPNAVLLNCLEIKRGEKVGLFNPTTQEVLNPQYDFILPGSSEVGSFAYACKSGKWYEIHSESLNRPKVIEFDQEKASNVLSFDTRQFGKSLMYEFFPGHLRRETHGILIVPSYVEYFNYASAPIYAHVLDEERRNNEHYTDKVTVEFKDQQSISEKVYSFFVSVYEEGIDARGYAIESEQMVLYHSEEQKIRSVPLTSLHDGEFYREAAYQLIGDSLVEVRSNQEEYKLERQLYNFETRYRYLRISPEGTVIELDSDRHFDFTKYILIDDSYLKGRFARYMEGSGYKVWESDHLTIEDLDLMRNEIFAEYGYRFKSERWRNYFSQKKWYKSQYDNVDDQLTAIDKNNIKVILKAKEAMRGREQEFTKRRQGVRIAAG